MKDKNLTFSNKITLAFFTRPSTELFIFSIRMQPIYIKKYKTNVINSKSKNFEILWYKQIFPLNLLRRYRVYLCLAMVTLMIIFFIRPRTKHSDERYQISEFKLNYLQNPIEDNCKGPLCGVPQKIPGDPTNPNSTQTIIVITPTNKRLERLPDLTRFSQTLMHIKNLHWIVVEDGIKLSNPVERLLNRSGIPYAYFFAPTQLNLPGNFFGCWNSF